MKRLYSIVLTFVFCMGIFLPVVYAGPGKIVPFISLKQEYTDNLSFSSSNEKEDFITTCTGGIKLAYDSETVKSKVTGQLFHLFYWDNDDLDATNGSVDASVKYQATERIGLGASADYRQDSRRDTDADTTGLILNGDRERANFSLSSSMTLSETMQGEMSAGFGLVQVEALNYDEDNDSYSLNFGLSKNLSKTFDNTTGLLNFSYLHYTSENQTYAPGTSISTRSYMDYESDVFQLYTGFSKAITELYSFYLQAGVSYTDTTEGKRVVLTGAFPSINIPSADQDSDTLGGVLLSGVNYDGLYWDLGISVSHDVRGGTGSNGTVERSSISFDLDRKVSDEFSLLFRTSCYLNQNERSTQADLEELTFNVQPGFKYQFLDTFSLSGIYRYTMMDDRQTNTSTQRSLVYLTLRKDFEL